MTISDHLLRFHGLPIFDFPHAESGLTLPAADAAAWRISVEPYGDSDETWAQAFARFLAEVDTTKVRALLIGLWGEAYDHPSDEVIGALVAAKDRFPALRAVFLGEITYEEAEISWIQQSDVTPLLTNFPALEEFRVRGGAHLQFPAIEHANLRTLVVETGGLGGEVVRGIAASTLPVLEHLELWLGVSEYGGSTTVADLAPLLSGERLPKLVYLGLRNSEIQDEVAAAVATAPVVARLSVLDLSMGTLGDAGATALLQGQPLTHLRRLDLHHHFISESVQERLRKSLEPEGVTVDLSEAETEEASADPGDRRYTAVAE
ncbi:leucine-rich repeat domain-containing protein [Nocardia yunnanensis]|uniref:Leucine-rich repeat domain-containing protein n=1 Tax=Nocardia yunnanensis TaxID=2382165 RepID=A0A386ZJA4_9NOCA|nr:STM4015 family protein [Nocardia yunnanensis]AYF76699.1 leucine-rich repeat domain-containing protein [Nocardia yunnanensis]